MFVIFIGRDNWWSLYLSKASCSRQCLVPAAVQHPPATSFDVLTAIDTLWALRDMPTISGKIIGYNGDIMWYIYIHCIYIYIQIWVCPKRGDTPNIQLWLGNWWYNIKHSGVLHFQTKPLGIGKTFSSSCWLRDVGWGPKYLAKGFPECGCNVVNPLPQAFFLGMVFLFCTPKGKLG